MANHTSNRDSFAMRLGQSLGRGVGRILRAERSVWAALSRAGVPSVLVTLVKWIARAVLIGGGAYFAAIGLLYVMSVVAFVAIIVGVLTNDRSAERYQLVHLSNDDRKAFAVELRRAVYQDAELPYGMHENVFGQTKGTLQSDSEWR